MNKIFKNEKYQMCTTHLCAILSTQYAASLITRTHLRKELSGVALPCLLLIKGEVMGKQERVGVGWHRSIG